MAGNVNVPDLVTGVKVASDDIGGVQYQRIKLDAGADGVSAPVTYATPLPVTLPAAQVPPANTGYSTDAKLDTVVTALQNLLTELQLKADLSETQPASLASVPSHEVTGPLTDTELRATAVSVTGTVTANTGLDQPLTDTQLRATALPVSGTVDTGLSQPLTDTQLRDSAVPVSLDSVPSHAVTEEDGSNVAIGATTDAAVVTDAAGSLSAKLRGLIKLLVDKITVNLSTDADSAIGKVKIMAHDSESGYIDVEMDGMGGIRTYIDGVAGGIPDRTDMVYDGGTAITNIRFATISASSSGNNTIVAASANKKIRVLSLTLTFSGGVNAKFQSAAGGTDKTGLIYGVTGVPFVLPYNKLGWFETAASALLNLNLSAAVAVGGCLTYIEV
jgi:hypothetical protein